MEISPKSYDTIVKILVILVPFAVALLALWLDKIPNRRREIRRGRVEMLTSLLSDKEMSCHPLLLETTFEACFWKRLDAREILFLFNQQQPLFCIQSYFSANRVFTILNVSTDTSAVEYRGLFKRIWFRRGTFFFSLLFYAIFVGVVVWLLYLLPKTFGTKDIPALIVILGWTLAGSVFAFRALMLFIGFIQARDLMRICNRPNGA